MHGPFQGSPDSRPGGIKEERSKEGATQAVARAATRGATTAIQEGRTGSLATKYVITGMIPDAIVPAVGGHTFAEDVGVVIPIQYAAKCQDVQGSRIRPSHGISKEYEYWRKSLRGHPDKRFVQRVLNNVLYGVKIGYTG